MTEKIELRCHRRRRRAGRPGRGHHHGARGLKVIVIERGRFAGAKNLFGGVLYTSAIAEVLPDFWKRNRRLSGR